MKSKQFAHLLFSILFLVLSLSSFAQFTDDFTDGDFTNNPTWTGNSTDFQVNTSFELQLNAPPVTSSKYLVTPSQAIGNAQYDFKVRLDFSPSTSNYARVYLTSSSSNLLGSLNGYFVQIGGASGALDDVSLYYQNGTSGTKIISGANGTVAVDPEVNVRVTRDMNGNWELLIDTALNGTYVSEGTIFHNTTTTSSYFGVQCEFTSSRSDKFFFDNFVVTGGPVMDIDPPAIDSVVSISATELDVYLNEDVEQTTAETPSNYSVNNGVGNPNNAQLDATHTNIVHLSYSNTINNNNYIITVNNVEDIAGNATVNATLAFTVNIPIAYNYGDVVINEIFPDPTPTVALPEAEFIELTNTTTSNINLYQWKYSDASTQVSLPNFVLAPNAHVIVCSENDTNIFTGYGDVIGLSSWPTLNNGGDFLGLRGPTNNLIDTVPYTDSWYQDGAKSSGGWTLERINPTALCSDANNWIASKNNTGGTPGAVNSVYDITPDLTIPEIVSYEIFSNTTIRLYLNKAIDSTSVSASSFSMNQGISIGSQNVTSLQSIELEVTPALANNLLYELLVTGITDCYGTSLPDTTITVAIGVTPGVRDIIFNEIYATPTLDNPYLPNAEFVEIMNTTSLPVSLNGVTFADQSTTVNLPNEVLLPNEIAILTEDVNANDFNKFGRVISLASWPSLNNSEDRITLANTLNDIDVVQYNDTWYNDNDKKSGWSLELINPITACVGKNNWTTSIGVLQATPGQENSVYDPNFVIDFRLISASALSTSQVEVVFSKIIDATNLTNNQFIWDNGISTQNILVDPAQPNVAILDILPNLEIGTQYKLTANNILDCAGENIGDSTAILSLPEEQSMLINEILFNPNTGGSDYIELYNTSSSNIDLKNWSLMYYNTSGDSAYKFITENTFVVEPGQFVVLTEDSGNIQFEYPYHGEGTFLVMDLPTYSNSSGHVIVLNQMGLLNDEFLYTEDMHFELITDPKGVSLERVNYLKGANTSDNWHSAASTSYYGTPGLENSQYLNNTDQNKEVTVSPKTFSPNLDGYKDLTSISYQFNASGFVATVTVHNDQGQEVKMLMNNQSIDASGELTWDGTNANNEVLPTGMYIVMFRIFNLENEQHVYKNVVVLAMP